MDLGELKAKISLSTNAFEAGVKKVLSGLSGIAGGSDKTAASMKTARRAMNDYQKGLLLTIENLKALAREQSEQIKWLKSFGMSTEAAQKRLIQLGRSIADLRAKQLAAAASTSNLKTKQDGLFLTLKKNITSFKALKQSMGSMFIGLIAFNQAAYFLQNTFNLLWRAVSGIGGAFVDAASKAEQFKMRMQSALRSASAGSELYDKAVKYATTVPFTVQEVLQSATALSPIVQEGMEGVMKWMPMIADLAALTGLTMREATGNFIKMYSAGAAAADLFRERGILPLLGFLPKVSYSVDETRKRLEEMKPALEGISARLSFTLQGQVSMIQDKWFRLRDIFMQAGPFDFIKGFIFQLNKQFDSFLEKFQKNAPEIGARVAEMMQSFVLGLINLVERAIGIYNKLSPILSGIGSVVTSIWDGFSSLPPWLQELGLLGGILFGKKGWIMLAGASAAYGKLSQQVQLEQHRQQAFDEGHYINKKDWDAAMMADLREQSTERRLKLLKDSGYRDKEFLRDFGAQAGLSLGDGVSDGVEKSLFDGLKSATVKAIEVGRQLREELDYVNPMGSLFDQGFTKEQEDLMKKFGLKEAEYEIQAMNAGMSDYAKNVHKAKIEHKQLLEKIRKADTNPDKIRLWIEKESAVLKGMEKDLVRTSDPERAEKLAKAIASSKAMIELARKAVTFNEAASADAAAQHAARLKALKAEFLATQGDETSKLRHEIELIRDIDLSDTARQLKEIDYQLNRELEKGGDSLGKDERTALEEKFGAQKAQVLAQASADARKRIRGLNEELSRVGMTGVTAEFSSITDEIRHMRAGIVDFGTLEALGELEQSLKDVAFAKKEYELDVARDEISILGIRNKYLQEEVRARLAKNRAIEQAARLSDPEDRRRAEYAAYAEYANAMERIRVQRSMEAHETDSWIDGAKLGFQELAEATYSWGEVSKQTVQGVADSMAGTFKSIFIDASKGELKSLEEYALDMLGNIVEAMAQAIAQKMAYSMVAGIGSMMFAKGGVFVGGNVTPFASGGVVTKPTIFPFASGIGLMGEAGAEAIMPLTRLSNGDLGVRADLSGGARQVEVRIINESGKQIEARQADSYIDMQREIITIVVDGVANNVEGSGDFFGLR